MAGISKSAKSDSIAAHRLGHLESSGKTRVVESAEW